MNRWGWMGGVTAVGLLGAVAALIHSQELPRLSEHSDARLVGAFHAHSEDSHDSRLSWEALAMAARQRGLDFLIITDHNKQQATSRSLHGVTLLSFAELSTGFGHAVALGATYTLDKAQRADPGVLGLIRQAGGFAVVTHPSDMKRPWTGPWEGAGGLEIANISASARRYGGPLMLGLVTLAAAWPWQRELAFAQLYDRDTQALALWDQQPPEMVGFCGSDTHGWIDPALNLGAWSVVLDTPVAPSDAGGILRALRHGDFHCSAGLLGHDPVFELQVQARPVLAPAVMAWATARSPWAGPAATLKEAPAAEVASLTLRGPLAGAGDVELALLKDGRIWRRGPPPHLSVVDPPPGVWRAEVWVRLPHLLAGTQWAPAIYSQRLTLTPRAP